jgi:AraC-like DNA-binding protein
MKSKEVDEFEVIQYPKIENINIFFVNLINRTTHLHKDIEICYIIDGKMQICTKSGNYSAGKGSLLLFNSNEPHSLSRLEGPSMLLSIQVSPNMFKDTFPKLKNILFCNTEISKGMPDKIKSKIESELYSMTNQYFQKDFGFELPILSSIYTLVYTLMKSTEYKVIDKEEYLRRKDLQIRLSRITNFINENLSQKITLTETAESEGLSPTYFSHFFKDNFNITFQEFISNLRFDKALKLVSHTNLKILDISMECGFSDSKYMNKAFLRNCGYLPKEYRKQLEKIQNINHNNRKQLNPLTTQYIYQNQEEISRMLKCLKEMID